MASKRLGALTKVRRGVLGRGRGREGCAALPLPRAAVISSGLRVLAVVAVALPAVLPHRGVLRALLHRRNVLLLDSVERVVLQRCLRVGAARWQALLTGELPHDPAVVVLGPPAVDVDALLLQPRLQFAPARASSTCRRHLVKLEGMGVGTGHRGHRPLRSAGRPKLGCAGIEMGR